MNKLAFVLMFLMATSFMPFSAFAQEAESVSSSSTNVSATTIQSSSTTPWLQGQDLYYNLNGGAISFDGDTGGVTIFDQQGIVIDSDSYTVRAAEINTDVWSNLSTNDADFVINEYYDNIGNTIVTITKEDQTGKFITEYILTPSQGKIKTTAYFTNYSLPNHKVAFTETLQLVKDIEINGQPLDLDQYIGVTFDRQVLEQNQDIIIQARDSVYNAGIGFDKLWAVSVHENRMISLDYAGVDETQTAIGETASLDPTIVLAPTNVTATQDPTTGEVTVNFDAGTSFPAFLSDDYSSSSGWTQTNGTKVSVINGQVYVNNVHAAEHQTIHKPLGQTLGNTWTANFEYKMTACSQCEAVVLGFTEGATKIWQNGTDNSFSVFLGNSGGTGGLYGMKLGESSGLGYSFNTPIAMPSINVTEYLTVTRVSATDFKLDVYTDSNRTNLKGTSTWSTTVGNNVTGLDHVTHGGYFANSSTSYRTITWEGDNLTVADTSSTVASPTSYDVFSKGAGTNYRSHEFVTLTGLGTSADGTNNGATTGVTGKIGNAWDFDGSNDYTDLGSSLKSTVGGSTEFSFSGWIKMDTSQSGVIFGLWSDNYGDVGKVIDLRTDGSQHLAMYIRDGGSNDSGIGTTALTLGQWHHVVFVYDGSNTNIKFYLDGQLEQTITGVISTLHNGSSSPLRIGQYGSGGFNSFDGSFDEFIIYNDVLTTTEISSLYNSGNGTTTPSTSGLLAYYDFEDTGSTLTNQAPTTSTFQITAGSGDVNYTIQPDGVFNGITPISGGNSWNFDTSMGNGYGVTTNAVNTSVDQTYSMWLKFPLITTNYQYSSPLRLENTTQPASCWYPIMVEKGSGGSGSNHWLGAYKCTGTGFVSSGFDLNTLSSGWHHLTTVVDGGTAITHYIDGTQVSTQGAIAGYYPQGGATSIGDTWSGGNENIGHMDDLGIWNTTLSQSDITSLAQGTSPNSIQTNNLLQYYDFENNTSLPNLATGTASLGSSADGTLVNASTGQSSWNLGALTGTATNLGTGTYSVTGDVTLIYDDDEITATGGTETAWNIPAVVGQTVFNQQRRHEFAPDTLGSLADGTTGGATTGVTGKIGNAWDFGGTNSHEVATNDPVITGSGDFTISTWINGDTISAGMSAQSLLRNHGNTVNTDGFEYYLRYGIPTFYTSSGWQSIGSVLSSNTWYHLTLVRENGVVSNYVDGVSQGSFNNSHNITGSDDLYIGGANNYTSSNFDGTMDDTGIWNKALTSAEINSLYNSGNGQTPINVNLTSGLLAYYDFEDTGSTLTNQAPTTSTFQITAGSGDVIYTLGTDGVFSPLSSQNYKIHTFTSSSNFQITAGSGNVEYLVVGAGAGAGGCVSACYGAGGGSGGEFITGTQSMTTGTFTATIGSGGNGGSAGAQGNDGTSTIFDTVTALGGSGGAGGTTYGGNAGNSGALGGGGAGNSGQGGNATGLGNDGGTGAGDNGAGGGGMGSAGYDANLNGLTNAGDGGAGLSSDINGTLTWFSAGGGGGAFGLTSGTSGGIGGSGVGGDGVNSSVLNGNDAVVNSGSGGGGSAGHYGSTGIGGDGADGIIIVRYVNDGSITATGGTVTTASIIPPQGTVNLGTGTYSVTGDVTLIYDDTLITATGGTESTSTQATIPTVLAGGTMPTTYSDDFSTDGWVDTNFTGVSGGELTGDLNRSGTNHGTYLDLGSTVSNDKWMMQFKLNILQHNAGTNNSVALWLSDSQVVGINTSKDAIGLGLRSDGGDYFGLIAPDGTYSFYNASYIGTPNTGTYYVEVIRTSATSADLNIYSDSSYSTLLHSVTNHTISSGIQNLRYVVVQGMNDGGSGGTWNISIDDLQIWDGITDPSVTSFEYSELPIAGIAEEYTVVANAVVTGLGTSADGTNNGATTGVTGYTNNAWEFSNDYVDLGHTILSGTGDFSSSAMFKTSGNSGDIWSSYSSGAGAGGNELYILSNGLLNYWHTTGGSHNGTTTLNLNQWYNVIVVNEGGAFTMYLDGSVENTSTVSGNIAGTNMLIGGINGSGSFNGTIDDVVFWDRALTSAEITALQSDPNPNNLTNTDNLLAYYDFEQTGSTLTNIANTPISSAQSDPALINTFNVPLQTTNLQSVDGLPIGLSWNTGTAGANVIQETPHKVHTFMSGGWDLSGTTYDNVSVGAHDSHPMGSTFSDDGTKMYVVGRSTPSVGQYDLTTTWDLSTASHVGTKNISSQEGSPTGVVFSDDGTKMFIVGTGNDTVYEYGLTTAWDITTASYSNNSMYIGSSDSTPTALHFVDNGSKLFIVGEQMKTIYQWNLTTGYDLSTASLDSNSFNVGSQDTAPKGLFFNPLGTELYIMGDANETVYQYTLTTGHDLSTTSYTQSHNVSSQDTQGQDVTFNSLGTKMYITGDAGNNVYQYSIAPVSTTNTFQITAGSGDVDYTIQPNGVFNGIPSNGWGVTNASYDNKSINVSSQENSPSGISFKPDGTGMFITGAGADTVFYYTLSTAWDVSTASYSNTSFYVGNQDSTTRDIFFKSDGTEMYMVGYGTDEVFKYNLSTAWDISTASYSNTSFYVGNQEGAVMEVTFKPDGTKMYVTGFANNTIYEYDLSTAWDISTTSYSNKSFSVASQEPSAYGVTFHPDGTEMYVVGDNGYIYIYALTSAWDVTTASYTVSYHVGGQEAYPNDVFFSTDGLKMYVAGHNADTVFQYSTPSPTPLTGTASNLGVGTYSVTGDVSLIYNDSDITATGGIITTIQAMGSVSSPPVISYDVIRDGIVIATVSAPTTQYTDNNVTAGQTYVYEITASAVVGTGIESLSSNAMAGVPPVAPTNLAASPGIPIVMTWTQSPDPDPLTPVTHYTIERSLNGSTWSTLNSNVGNVSTYSDNTVTPGTLYHYQVAAVNVAGTSPFSTPTSAISGSPPSPPQNLAVVQTTTNQLDLSWQAPSNNGSIPITNYKIYRDANLIATVGNVLTYNDTTPAVGTQYIYHVTAVNTAGDSTNSNSIIITSWAVPDVPTNATATGGIPIVVNWTAPASSDKPVTNYKIYRDNTLLTTVGNVLTYSDSNVTPNTTYVYKISAVSIVGESVQSNPTSGQSGVPPAQISTFTVTPIDASRIQLDWVAPNDNGYPISGYNIYRGGTSIGTTAGLTYTDTGLINNTTYSYTVSAVNVGGEGTQSASQSATTSTPLTPPTNVYTEEHETSVVVSWDDVLNAISYTVERDGTILTTTASFIYTDTTTVSGTGYIYKVYANSSAINGLVGTSNTVTTAPSTPHQYITVTPTAPANNAYTIDKYQMYRNNVIVGYVAPNTDYVDHDLAIGTTYTYAFKAHNILGWSQLSPLTSITTWDVPDQVTQLSGTTGSPIVLNWIAPASDRPITLYTIYRDGNLLATSTTLTYSDTTVVAGTTYVYSVSATSHVGEGAQSAGLSLQAGTVPTAPTLTLAVLANNQIRMDWTVPSSNGGVAISGYNPQVSTDNGTTWTNILSNPTTALTLLNQNLTQGQNYTYQVAAINAVGTGPYSTALSAVSGNIPAQVTGVNTTAISDTEIDIDWNIPANNSYAITGYNLFRSLDQTNWTTVSTTINTNSYSDTGLTADTVYYYKVSATNVLGTGAESSIVSQRTFGLPDPVTALVLTPQSTSQINTSWTQPNLNGFPLVSYTVERSTNGTSGWTTISSGSTNTTFNDTTGLVQNTVYHYRVTTTNTFGSTIGTVVNATTYPVATNLVTATTQSNTSIQINWNAIAGNGVVQYNLERSTDGITWNNVTLLISGTTYTDTGLTPLTQYQYRVTSVNSSGSSSPSTASVPVTTFDAPEPPTNITLLALVNAEIQIDWIAPTVTNGAPVTSYNIERSTNGTTWSTLINNVNALTHTDTGLTTSQVYHYRVAANNIYGTSVFSASANVMASDVPSQVTGLTATTLPNYEIQLDWVAPNSNGYNISGYTIERSTDGGTTWNILIADTQNTNIIYTDINLTVSQVYHYRVSAINQVGTGMASTTANATAGDVPSANVLTATPIAPGQIDLSWTVPNSNGFALTKYTVDRSLDGITWTTIASILPSIGTTHSDTGLNIGTLYYYRILTENAVGFSVASNVESLNAGDVPGIAASLTGTTQSDTQVLLNWTASAPNGYPVTGYKIEQSINNSVWTVVIADTQSTQISYTVSSLTPATDYYYRVSGINQLGTSTISNTASVHTFGPPEPVTSVTPVATDTTVTLNWVAPYDHGSAITGYKIEVKDFITGNWLNLTTVQTTTYTQINMIQNTLYEYQITAINQYGTSVSQTIPVSTLATAPATPTVTTISGTELKVEWPAVSGTGITYTIYTSPDDITYTAGPVGHPTAYFDHQGLTNGQTVYYKITILNSSGESPKSSSASGTTWTVPGAPTNLQVTHPTPLSATLTWTAPTNDGGDTANLSYTVQRSNDNLNWVSLIPTTNTTATDTSLVVSTQYYWRVNSVNSVGIGGDSTSVSYLTPGLPTAPSNLTATLTGSNNNSAALNWSTPSSNGGKIITGYEIQRSLNGGSTWSTLVSDTGSTGTVYTNTGLTLGQLYTYQVAAITIVGTGPYSNNASVQPSLITVSIAGTPQGGNSVVVTPTVSLTGPANINFVKVSLYKNNALTDSYLKTGPVASGALTALTSYPTVTSDFYVVVKFDTGFAVQSNTISLTPAAPFSGDISFSEDRIEYDSTTCVTAGGIWNQIGGCSVDFTVSDLDFTVQPVGADVIIKYQPQNLNEPPIVKAFTSTNAVINELTDLDPEKDYYGSIFVNPTFNYNINGDGTIQIICDPTDMLCDDSDIDPVTAGVQSNVPPGTPAEKTFKSFKDPDATQQLGIEPMGNLFGVNMVFIFVIALAGIFTGRSAPMGVVFIIVTLGIMAYLGYLDFGSDELNTATWGLLIISAILGIFLGKRWS